MDSERSYSRARSNFILRLAFICGVVLGGFLQWEIPMPPWKVLLAGAIGFVFSVAVAFIDLWRVGRATRS